MFKWLACTVIYGAYSHFQYISERFLDNSDHYILITNHIMLLGVLVGGCLMHVIYQTSFGIQVSLILLVLSYSKQRDSYQLKYFFIGIAYALLWTGLKVWTSKSWDYGAGTLIDGVQYFGVEKTLGCWNCSYIEFTLYPLAWITIELVGICDATRIMHDQEDSDHSWKEYLIKYKVRPDIFSLAFQIIFNIVAFFWIDQVPQCTIFWVGSQLWQHFAINVAKTIMYIMPALSTYYFYYKTRPLFKRRSSRDSTEQLLSGSPSGS